MEFKMKIVFLDHDDNVCILHPTPEAEASMSMIELGKKDVPKGLPFKVVNNSDIPTDRTFREAWTIDKKYLTDGVGE